MDRMRNQQKEEASGGKGIGKKERATECKGRCRSVRRESKEERTSASRKEEEHLSEEGRSEVGSNEAESERGGKRRIRKRRKEHQNGRKDASACEEKGGYL